MHIVSRSALKEYWQKYSEVEQQLKSWYYEAKHAEWKKPEDIKKRYADASILPDNRFVFKIKGNHYRLVVKIHYNKGIIYIRFIGTHAEYDKIDAETI